MTENEAIIIAADLIDEASSLNGFGIRAVQNYQPTQQGIDERAVYLEVVNKSFRGWAHTKADHIQADEQFIEKERQLVQVDIQVMVFSPKDPEQPSLPTAFDIASTLRAYLLSRNTIGRLQKRGIGVLRTPEAYNPKIVNDREQFQAHPNFLLSLTGASEITFRTPAVYHGEWDFIEGV